MSYDGKTQVAIIGCGHWGFNYLRILSSLRECAVSAVCDVDEAQLEKARVAYPQLRATTSIQDVLADPVTRAVVIATPAGAHAELGVQALLAGKDLLIEKPMATSIGEAETLVELARDRQRVLMVGHTFLYNPAIVKLKEFIDAGRLGKIYYINTTRTHLGLVREDVNAVWDLAPHDVAILSYLLSDSPLKVSAVGACHLREGREDVAYVSLIYPESVIAHIHVSWSDSNKQRKVHVVGSAAHAVFDDIDMLERLKIYEKGIASNVSSGDGFEFPYLLRDGDIYSPRIDVKEPLKEMCAHFVDCVARRGQPLTDGLHGLNVVRILCAIERSLSGEGAPVAIE